MKYLHYISLLFQPRSLDVCTFLARQPLRIFILSPFSTSRIFVNQVFCYYKNRNLFFFADCNDIHMDVSIFFLTLFLPTFLPSSCRAKQTNTIKKTKGWMFNLIFLGIL